MAVSSESGPFSAASRRHRGDQIRLAFQALITADSPPISSLLSLVTPGGRSPLIHELAAWATASGLRVLFRDGGRFGEEIREAESANCWERLRRRVTTADLVVIEHVEAIGCHSRLSSFRHLVDAANCDGTRLCLSLASHPVTGHLPPDLAGRLAGGLVIPLAQEPSITPPADPHLERRQNHSPSLERIFAATARHYGIDIETLVGQSRSRTVCHARSLAMYLARNLTGRSFSIIGQACGDRDHTTALHGTRITSARILADPGIAADVAAIRQALGPRSLRRRPGSTLSMDRR